MKSFRTSTLRATALSLAIAPAVALAQNAQPQQGGQNPSMQPGQGTQQQSQRMQQQGTQQQGGNQPTIVFEDVEELNDAGLDVVGRSVSVEGEVEEYVAPGAIVLESGGWFDDEIAVVVPKGVKTSPDMFEEDSELRITGRVINVPIVEVERELGWDLDPEIEVEIEEGKTYLIADEVIPGTS